MIEIRGQQATDWRDVYEIRVTTSTHLPYIRPDWVRDELDTIKDGAWPLVAVAQLPDGPRVVARTNIQLGWGRRSHSAVFTLERHPNYGDEPARTLLQEAVHVSENWWNRHRLETTAPANDADLIALFESFGFEQEARLRQGVRIQGELVDEIVLARVSGAAASETAPPAPAPIGERSTSRPAVTVRGGSADDWRDMHAIWAQPRVIWGTMQIPYPSADRNRQRVQEGAPPRFWSLVADVDGQLVGVLGHQRGEHNRAHAGHVGMMVHQDYQGMGIGSALMEAITDLADNWLGLTRLQLEVYPDNEPAVALYHKFGFETEGLLRALAYRDGHYVDTLIMGRLRD